MAPTLRHNPSTCHRSCCRGLVVPHLHCRVTEGKETVRQEMLARRYAEQKQAGGEEEVAEDAVVAMGTMVVAATATIAGDDDDNNGNDQGNTDHDDADLDLSVAIAMSIDDEQYTEYLRSEGRRQLALTIARSLAVRPDVIDNVHQKHPEPQPEC